VVELLVNAWALRPDQFAAFRSHASLRADRVPELLAEAQEHADFWLLVVELAGATMDRSAFSAHAVSFVNTADPCSAMTHLHERVTMLVEELSAELGPASVSETYLHDLRGVVPEGASPGRNDDCPCGSGRKYKRCHADAERPLYRQQVIAVARAEWDELVSSFEGLDEDVRGDPGPGSYRVAIIPQSLAGMNLGPAFAADVATSVTLDEAAGTFQQQIDARMNAAHPYLTNARVRELIHFES
jgi:uncharacterized protein YchJ